MASPPRVLPYQAVHTLRATVTFEDDTVAVAIGSLPNNAVISPASSGLYVGTAFDDTTTDLVDVGFAAHTNAAGVAVVADPNAYGSAIDVAALGFKPLDEAFAASITDANGAGVPVTATYTGATGDPSVGTMEVIIHYTVDG